MGLRPTKGDEDAVGRTPSSAADPLVGLFVAPASQKRASVAARVRPTASSTERYPDWRGNAPSQSRLS